MVELLKTSMMVTVTVIPPHPDGAPRRGCNLANCPYAFGARTSSADSDSGSGVGREGDYENVGGDASVEPQVKSTYSILSPSNEKRGDSAVFTIQFLSNIIIPKYRVTHHVVP